MACGSSASPSPGDEDDGGGVGAVTRLAELPTRLPEGDCADVGGAHALRTVPQSKGTEVDLMLHPVAGGALDPQRDYGHCVTAAGPAWRRPFDGRLTFIVVRPDDVESVEALTAFILDRPADEELGVLLWTDEILAVDMPTRDRARTLLRLTAALDDVSASVDGAVPSALKDAVDLAVRAGGFGRGWLRSVLVWAPSFPAPNVAAPSDGTLSAKVVSVAAGEGDVVARATAAGRQLDDAWAAGYYGVGICGTGKTAKLKVGDADFVVELPGLADELAAGPACDPDYTALGGFPYATRMEFEIAKGDVAAVAKLFEDNDKSDFTVGVRWHSALPAVPSVAHLRGQSSLKCARKSFTVDLDGGDARVLMPGFAADEFYLVSMCLDEDYLNQITADRLMAGLGMFPLAFMPIELVINGESAGLYLLMEKPDEALRASDPVLHSLVRRRIDIDGKAPSLEWAESGGEADALAAYEQLVPGLGNLEGDALLDALDARMDFTAFLRWIALMTVLKNGDYVDEINFAANRTWTAPEGIASPNDGSLYYTVIGWDPDDLFSTCHHGGIFAIKDPNGLLYCAEGLLEHRVFADPVVYARYVDVLEEVLDTVDAKVFGDTLDQTAADVTPFLQDDDVRKALVEFTKRHPDATTDALAVSAVNDGAAAMKASYKAQAKLLRERIAAYRALP